MASHTSAFDRRLHAFLWISLVPILWWSFHGCFDRTVWVLEVFPVFIGTAILLATYRRFTFTPLVCWLMWLHAIVLIVGGHYTYERVPPFNAIRDFFNLARNHYDRLGHFMQGFVPAMVAREILLRRDVLKRQGWLFYLVVSIVLAISAAYEFLEWGVAEASGTRADAFLATQGDVWDTQWDMFCALIGAVTALLALSRWHNRQLRRF